MRRYFDALNPCNFGLVYSIAESVVKRFGEPDIERVREMVDRSIELIPSDREQTIASYYMYVARSIKERIGLRTMSAYLVWMAEDYAVLTHGISLATAMGSGLVILWLSTHKVPEDGFRKFIDGLPNDVPTLGAFYALWTASYAGLLQVPILNPHMATIIDEWRNGKDLLDALIEGLVAVPRDPRINRDAALYGG